MNLICLRKIFFYDEFGKSDICLCKIASKIFSKKLKNRKRSRKTNSITTRIMYGRTRVTFYIQKHHYWNPWLVTVLSSSPFVSNFSNHLCMGLEGDLVFSSRLKEKFLENCLPQLHGFPLNITFASWWDRSTLSYSLLKSSQSKNFVFTTVTENKYDFSVFPQKGYVTKNIRICYYYVFLFFKPNLGILFLDDMQVQIFGNG